MADTFPEGFIPVGDAFDVALSSIRDCNSVLKRELAGNQECIDKFFDDYDVMARYVEGLMRAALADRDLPAFIKAGNGQPEELAERESWRQKSLGVPNLESVPHHLGNPGPDTDGQPALLKRSDFECWLARQTKDVMSVRPGLVQLKKPIAKAGPRRAARLALDAIFPEGISTNKTGQELTNVVNNYLKRQPSDLIEGRVKQEVSLDTVLRAAERK